MTGKVYVVQEPMKWDPDSQSKRPKFDMKPAAEYGEPVVLLAGNHAPLDTEAMVQHLHDRLKNYGDEDFILPTGNPTAIGLAIGIAALKNGGNVQLLVWHRESRCYLATRANLYGQAAQGS